MNARPYTGITFRYDTFLKDIDRFRVLSEGFLRTESTEALKRFRMGVENVRNAAGGTRLEIPTDRCLRTVESAEYRSGGQERRVYGTLCFRWEVAHRDKAIRKQNSFDLFGEATTEIRIFEENAQLIAQWQFEVGDSVSPGCHFHTSVNQRGEDGLFPRWLKVPRLPGLLVSPFDGMDFLLGELFPEGWTQRISQSSDVRNQWATSQSHRMLKILQWQCEVVKNSKSGTPWISLKKAKPSPNLFS